ncbi:Far1-related sequence [Thalictrum thalictroides]|uniref:Far1-related sequence n=1 Tax=Thalictrum thalictroides TaxID=46969 RepID=A0A7J6WNY4_THATH|nr:Far1-related sequence [Thalictrum thalictroides]
MEFEPLNIENDTIDFDMGFEDDDGIDIEHPVDDDEMHEALKFVDEGAKSIDIYNVAVRALQDAARKVALAKMNSGKLPLANGSSREDGVTDGMHSNDGHQCALVQHQSPDEKEKKMDDLSYELDRANRKCEVYRANLLSILKDIEEQKLQLNVKVQNIKLGMKD